MGRREIQIYAMLLLGCAVKTVGLGRWKGWSEFSLCLDQSPKGQDCLVERGCWLVTGLLASRKGSVPEMTFECVLAIVIRTFLRGRSGIWACVSLASLSVRIRAGSCLVWQCLHGPMTQVHPPGRL